MKLLNIKLIFLCICVCVLSSCLNDDKYNLDRLSNHINIEPEVLIPLASLTTNIASILRVEKDSLGIFSFDENGIICIKHKQELDLDFNLDELLSLSEQAPVDGALAVHNDGVFTSLNDTISRLIPIKIKNDTITLNSLLVDGSFRFSIKNPLSTVCIVRLEFPKSKYGDTQSRFTKEFNIPPKSFIDPLVEFKHLDLTMDDEHTSVNILNINIYLKTVYNPAGITTSGDFEYNFQFTDLDYISAGINLKHEFHFPSSSSGFKFDLDLFDKLNDQITFVKPELKLNLFNSIGIPMSVEMDFKSEYSDNPEDVFTTGLRYIKYPKGKHPNEPIVVTSIELDKSTKQDELINALQDGNLESTYKFTIGSRHKDDNYKGNYFINKTDSIKGELDFKLPLYIKADSFIFTDTIKDLNMGKLTDISNASIYLFSKNRIPLGVSIDKLYMLDANYAKIDSLDAGLLVKAADVSAGKYMGLSREETENTLVIDLTEGQLDNLKLTKNFIIKSVISTTPDRSVKLTASDSLVLSIALKAKININN